MFEIVLLISLAITGTGLATMESSPEAEKKEVMEMVTEFEDADTKTLLAKDKG